MSSKVARANRNETATAGTAIQCARARVPCGATRLSTLYLLRTSSPFHQVQFFGGDGVLAAVERDDDGQPHGNLRRRDREREEDEDLSRDFVQVVREGHEVD